MKTHTPNKYRQTLSQYPPLPPAKDLTNHVQTLLNTPLHTHFTPQTLQLIHSCLDLTTLTPTDTHQTIRTLIQQTLNPHPHTHPHIPPVAAICTYPLFVPTVRQTLTAPDIKIAAVAGGFPSSQTFPEIKIAETALALHYGAQEIDLPMNIGYYLEENYQTLTDELTEIKDTCRGATLKIILETSALQTPENIRKATILALHAGADFIKTSTGKQYPGPTPEAIYTICQTLHQYAQNTGRKAGLKISGGIRTAQDAVRHYTLVHQTLGPTWLHKNHFRIGATHLHHDLQKHLPP